MSTALTYADLRSQQYIRTPLDDELGRGWQTAMGEIMDEELRRTVWSARVGWPDWAPEDALLYIGAERRLEQVYLMKGALSEEREATADYRVRLREAWGIWNVSGSQDGHADEFGWTGLQNVSVHRRKEWSMPLDDASTPSYVKAFQRSVWSQFDVLIDRPHPWEGVYWGTSGMLWVAFNWGSTATKVEVDQLRRLLRQHKSAHDTATWIVVNLARGAQVWGGFDWADGATWNTGTTPHVIRWLVGEDHWVRRGLV